MMLKLSVLIQPIESNLSNVWIGMLSSMANYHFVTQFEEMMDRLEKSSGQTVVTLNEAKSLLKQDDDFIIAVYDYWLNKRLKMVSNAASNLKETQWMVLIELDVQF